MMIFVWTDLDRVSDNYHSGGGIVIVAESETDARVQASKIPFLVIPESQEPHLSAQLGGDHEPQVIVFPDAGCCKYTAWISLDVRAEKLRGRGEGKAYPKLNGRHAHRVVAEETLGRKLRKGCKRCGIWWAPEHGFIKGFCRLCYLRNYRLEASIR